MIISLLYLSIFYMVGAILDNRLKPYGYHQHKFIVNTSISLIHACIVCSLGIINLSKYDSNQLDNSLYINNILAISVGYFVYDSINICILHKSIFTIYTIHHLLALIPTVYSLYYNIYGGFIYNCLLLGELTNPIMQLVELNKLVKVYNNHWIYNIEYYNIVVYCIIRFLVVPTYYITMNKYIQDNVLFTLSGISMSLLIFGSYSWVQSKYNIMPDWDEYMHYS